MQKIELLKNLQLITNKTLSTKLIDFFNGNQKENSISSSLLLILVESKSGFDQLILDEKQEKILKQFNAHKYYETSFFSAIIRFVSNNNYDTKIKFLQQSKALNDFFTYHNTLLTTLRLIANMLFEDSELNDSIFDFDYKKAENEGFLYFEILANEKIDFETFTVVIQNINILVNNVYDALNSIDNLKSEEKPKMILADSGSNTNISIKLPKAISQAIAKIINDTWNLISNNSGFKLDKLNNNLSKSLQIIEKINSAEKEENISAEQAEIWRRNIINSTEKIILNNTLTKSKAEEVYILSNQKMLVESTKKYLNEKNK